MAYVMMSRLERDTRRTSMILRNTQAEFYAQGSIAWAMDQLRNNWERQRPNKFIDETPIKSPEIDVNGYQVSSTIYDLQSRFNLNTLNSNDAQNDFKRLLQAVIPELNEEKARGIVSAIHDWITPVTQATEFSKYYTGLPLPYRPAHRLMVTSSELNKVKGITPELFNRLNPYITALPADTAITIREVQVPVLLTLHVGMTLSIAKALAQFRDQNLALMFNPLAFLNAEPVRDLQIPSKKVAVVSSYFLVETEVTIENQHVLLYTLLERATKDNKAVVTILWQSKGI